MVEHLQQGAVEAENAAEAERYGDDAHVLDGGVGKEPFEVPPPHHEDHADEQSEEPEDEQDVVGIGVAQPCLGDGLETDDGVHAGV